MTEQFIYVTYIHTSPAKLWQALTDPAFVRQYWFGMTQECSWEKGAPWTLKFQDGKIADAGEVLEADPPRRLVLKWRNEFIPELKQEGFSRCVMEIEANGELTKLTVTHSIDKEGSKLVRAVSGGWPKILSSLKTLLETGAPLPVSASEAVEVIKKCAQAAEH
jgi:uncharacterized protein YndB with AHSA1/START domain